MGPSAWGRRSWIGTSTASAVASRAFGPRPRRGAFRPRPWPARRFRRGGAAPCAGAFAGGAGSAADRRRGGSDRPGRNRGVTRDYIRPMSLPAEHAEMLDRIERRARYLWAAQVAEGRAALDVGCRDGASTAALSAAGAEPVVAVDPS